MNIETRFSCPFCSKSYETIKKRKRHIRTRHMKRVIGGVKERDPRKLGMNTLVPRERW